MTTWFQQLVEILIRFCLLIMAGWATLAILFSTLPGFTRFLVAGLFGIGSLFAIFGRYGRPAQLGLLLAFAVVLGCWLSMSPSNNRNWQPDVILIPWAEIQGNNVTIHNIRNCDYRSETDYTVRHYDKTIDLPKLKSVDVFLVYWGVPFIAHTILSFGFEGDGFVSFSVETRKEVGEAYSNIKGFFRQYEITYIVADERDLVGLRTNYRKEQVYLYRIKESEDVHRKIFLDYLQEINSLKEHPQWYNALTDNCTTSIRGFEAPFNPDGRLDWRIIINGYLDKMLYEKKLIDTSLPFSELKKQSLINERAKGLDKSPAFSQKIRAGLPGFKSYSAEK